MSNPVKNELEFTRIFDVPRELVWKAWTEPEHFKRWWGPKTFTCPSCKMDFRIGGKYLYCMHSGDGKDYWTTGSFREIVPMEKIVYTDSFSDEKGNEVPPSYYDMSGEWTKELIVTVTLEDLGGKTKMTLQHTGIPSGPMSDGAKIGWNESFDKLAESLK